MTLLSGAAGREGRRWTLERVRFGLPFLLVSLTGWGLLLADRRGLFLPMLCADSPSGLPVPAALDMALALNPPGALAMGWATMLTATMAPLLIAPVWALRAGAPGWRQGAVAILFIAGYGASWMLVGAGVLALALAIRVVAPGSWTPTAIAAALVLGWQVSPTKRRSLDLCRAHGALASGLVRAPLIEALRQGATHGWRCVGAGWALMLAPLLVAQGHLILMVSAAAWMFLERQFDLRFLSSNPNPAGRARDV